MATRDVSSQSDITKMKYEADGHFRRAPSTFREVIAKEGKYTAEKGRYHLYVSYACPWAHRTLIVRKLKGLTDFIDVTVVSPLMGSQGWPFNNIDPFPGADSDPLHGAAHIKDIYLKVTPDYEGRFTVPVLFDKKTNSIVNNESSEIIRIFNTAFNDLLPADKAALDLYPANLQKEIDGINEWVYDTVNNGVYRSGFATTQTAYEDAVQKLFASLDRLEDILSKNGGEFLVGGQLTEADVRLFTTIVRFDPVYHGHFKCNLRLIRHGYPAINKWLKKHYWENDAFKSTTEFNHIKTHYYWSHVSINPTRVVPFGPIPLIEPQ